MDYEVYKLIHIVGIVVFFGVAGATFLGESYNKHQKIIMGVSSFFILLGGMGLMARIGIEHGSMWPSWLIVKGLMWLILAILTPICAKKLVPSVKFFYFFVFVGSIAIYMAINKPF